MRSTPPRRPRQPASLIRPSNQVGTPWILDGKMFRGATGTPMRRMALAKSRFADADPEPLTLANLTTKSLTRWIGVTVGFIRPRLLFRLQESRAVCARPPARSGIDGRHAGGRGRTFACPRRPLDSARHKDRSAGTRPRPWP